MDNITEKCYGDICDKYIQEAAEKRALLKVHKLYEIALDRQKNIIKPTSKDLLQLYKNVETQESAMKEEQFNNRFKEYLIDKEKEKRNEAKIILTELEKQYSKKMNMKAYNLMVSRYECT